MTAASAAPRGPLPSAASPDPGAETLGATPDWLDGELRERLARTAARSGLNPAQLVNQWVIEGLERLEAEQAAPESAGRCSLRTGTCTAGPVPLPVHQQ